MAVLACLIGLAPLWRALQGQSVQGVVTDSASGRPLNEFIVELVNPDGVRVAAALGQVGGAFFLRAPSAGEFRLRVSRIGYKRTTSAPFSVRDGEIRSQSLALPQISTRLAGIRTETDQRCSLQPGDGSAVATVWDEVRKAVQAVSLTGSEMQLRMAVHDYQREIAVPGDTAIRETGADRDGLSSRPYFSPDPDSIGANGFVQARGDHVYYYAPDAAILGSDAFVKLHCFHLRQAERRDSGLVGVAFEPIRGQRLPDVSGTAWLDEKTSELRSVDFSYTALSRYTRANSFGGHVDFAHLPGGSWLIRGWQIRAPVVRSVERVESSGGGFGGGSLTGTRRVVDSVLVAVLEEGGEVLTARAADGTLVWAGSYVVVHGQVRDSASRDPIVGAAVMLRGTGHRATTDAEGQFTLADVPPGGYTLVTTVSSPPAPPIVQAREVKVGRSAVRADVVVAATTVAEAYTKSARLRAQQECTATRARREREIDSTFAIPILQWHPAGRDSAHVAEVIRGAPTILQAVADTNGVVDLTSMRALRRGPASVYSAALAALGNLQSEVEQPLPGCKVRRLILMPYRIKADK
jgi:hypothetical protein